MTPAAEKPGTAPRKPSALDRLADSLVEEYAPLYPFLATSIGIPGHESEVPDLSPAGHDARLTLVRRALAPRG